MSGIVDSHAHLSWDSFAEDQSQVIARAFESNVVQIVQAGVDLKSIPEMLKISDAYPPIFAGIGLHPHEAKLFDVDTVRVLKETARHPKVVAIGECGLDFHYNFSNRQQQIEAFSQQVKLAVELKLPLIIHTREAWDETLTILEDLDAKSTGGVFHCFTGNASLLPRIEGIGFHVSFSGIVTFKNAQDIQAAAAQVASNYMLVETDCPYLTPMPLRGKRNEPCHVWLVAEKLAQIRSCPVAEIASLTSQNARRLFKLPELS